MESRLPDAPWASLVLTDDELTLEYAPLMGIIMELVKGFEQEKYEMHNLTMQLAEQQVQFDELKATVEDHSEKIVTISAKPSHKESVSSPRAEGHQSRLGKHVAAMMAGGNTSSSKKKNTLNDIGEIGGVSTAQLDKRLAEVDEKITSTVASLDRDMKISANKVKRTMQTLEDSVAAIRTSLDRGDIAMKIDELQESSERLDNDLETLRLHWQEDHAMKANKVDVDHMQETIRALVSNQREGSHVQQEAEKFSDEVSMINSELASIKARMVELLTSLHDESADIRAWASKSIRELTTEIQSKSDRDQCRHAQKTAKEEIVVLSSYLTDLRHKVSRQSATSADKNEVRKMDRQMEKVEQMLTMRNGTLLGAKCLSCNRSSSADRLTEARVDSQKEKDKIRVLNFLDLQKAYKEGDGADGTMKVVAMNVGKLAHHSSPERQGTDGQMYEIREKTGDVTDDVTFLPISPTIAPGVADRNTPRQKKRRHVHRGFVKPAKDFATTTQWFQSAGLSDILRTP